MTDRAPRRLVVVTRPVDADDVAIFMDGRQLEPDEVPNARAFLGAWRERARLVPSPRLTIAVAADATLVEVHTVERDEDGRLEPVAIWFSTKMSTFEALSEAKGFVRLCGRSFDEGAVESDLTAAARPIRLQRQIQTGGRFLGFLRRLLRRLTRRTSNWERTQA